MIVTPATLQEINQRRAKGADLQRQDAVDGLKPLKGYVLSSFTTHMLPELLTENLSQKGFLGKFEMGGFGQITQEILDPESHLYQASPDVLIILPAAEDWMGQAFDRPGSAHAQAIVEGKIEELQQVVRVVLERLPKLVCYIAAFGTTSAPSTYLLSPNASERGQVFVDALLNAVRQLETLSARVVVVDWEWHTRYTGLHSFVDERLWFLARMRLNPIGIAQLANLIGDHIGAYSGIVSKVVAVDLDNTMWGGIIGEVGLQGITLGEEGIGFAFQAFQKELLKLYDQGVILVVVSKNNHADAWEAVEHHPGMILQSPNFAAVRINWQDKATNLQEIAEELNLGLDSFVFLDDNPVERGWIKSALPQVRVPELPDDPVERVRFVKELPFFNRITLTESDKKRAESYKTQGLRRELQEKSDSIESFIMSLNQYIEIEHVTRASLARVAQMTQRTNQFNLTTQRYTPADIEAMTSDSQCEVVTLSVRDKFGDNGITGLAILKFDLLEAHIDTFLLSCRVLGRKIEDVLLAYLVARSQKQGVTTLYGRFIPTSKNQQVANFYPRRGFESQSEGVFQLDLTIHSYPMPKGIQVEIPHEEPN